MSRAIILFIVFVLCASSCKEHNKLSKEIRKSQSNYYQNNHTDKQSLVFFDNARREALKELLYKSTTGIQDEDIFFIEAFDITSGELCGMICIGETRFHYRSDQIKRNYYESPVSTIDSTMANLYIDGKNSELHNPMELSSITYLGTKVTRSNGHFIITHYHW